MSEQIKPDIILPLKRVWFAKIWNGEKTVEYREVKPYWEKRIGSWVGDNSPKFVLFQIGYMKNGPRILVQVSNTDIGPCPYVGWCGNFYRIHFSIICPYWKQDGNFFPMESMPRMKEKKGGAK